MTTNGPTAPAAPEGAEGIFALPRTIGEDEQEETPELTPEQQELAELRQQFQTQQEQWNQREQHYQSSLESLMSQRFPAQQAPAQPATPAAPQFSLDDLPDPIQSPSDFKAKLGEKIGNLIQQQSTSQQQLYTQMTRGQALDNVWNQFNTKHADLAKHEILVNGAASSLMSDLRARGIDPVQLAMQDPNSLVTTLANRVQEAVTQFGVAVPGTAPAAPGTAPAAPGAARTQGLAAGSASAGGPPAPKKPMGFVDQIRKAQLDSGLI